MSKKPLPPERLHPGWVLALVALCLVALSVQLFHISGSLPYPYHIDEQAVIGPARKMLVTGNFHPSEFNYPSLPRYLAAAGLAVGFVRAAQEDSDVRPDIHQIGSVGYPYYGTPTAVETSKQLFAVLSVIVLAMTGVIAWRVTRRPGAVIIGPAILASSELFFRHSWQYLNVDIVGTCFVVLTVASCLSATIHSSVARSAVVPAVWAGLAAASKYTLGLVFLPVLVGIWMYQEGDRRVRSSGIALATVCVSFLAAVPFALLDLPAFLNGLAFDAWHYGSAGHVGFNDEPGLTQLTNYGHPLYERVRPGWCRSRDGRKCCGISSGLATVRIVSCFPRSSRDVVGRSARYFHAERVADPSALRRRYRLRLYRSERMVHAVAPTMEPPTRWIGWKSSRPAYANSSDTARPPHCRARERNTGFAQPRP